MTDWGDDSTYILCMALNVNPDDPLPSLWYEGLETSEQLLAACKHRCQSLGCRLHAIPLEEVRKGYYYIVEDSKVACVLDRRDPVMEMHWGECESIEIENSFDANTKIMITSNLGGKSRTFEVTTLKQEFTEHGIQLPLGGEKWRLPADFQETNANFDSFIYLQTMPMRTPVCCFLILFHFVRKSILLRAQAPC